jgi:ribulose-phosphate 3-epimerase
MIARIIPSILTPNFSQFVARYRAVASAGLAQLDVLNGSFVPYRDFCDPKKINGLNPALSLEVHLMVRNLEREIPHWHYPWVKKIIFHLEATDDIEKCLQLIKRMKKLSGIALNPKTPVKAIFPFMAKIDTVLVMSVFPGRNSQKFLPAALFKVRALRKKSQRLNIEVDGGLNPQTVQKCARAGANLLVVGSYLDNARFKERMKSLKHILS